MQDLQDKLKDYKGKLNKAGVELKELGELIAIEIFDFITKDDQLLKDEFYRRLHYFKNISGDKAFIKLQDDLFDTISEILKTVRIDLVRKMQKSSGRAYINFLNIQEDTLSLVDIYEALQNKDNYYRLSPSDYYSIGEISIYYPSTPTRKQYEAISTALKDMTWINEIEKDKNKIKKSEELFAKFNDLHSELEEKLQRTPVKLHVPKFEEFYLFCDVDYKRDSEHYGHPYGQIENKPKLEKIRNTTLVIIEDMIQFLEKSKVKEEMNIQPVQKIKIRNISLNEENLMLEINGGEKIMSFKARKNNGGSEETKFFKIIFHLWDFREETDKVKGIITKGDWVSLDNLAKGSKSSEGSTSRNISRLRKTFEDEGVPIEIKASNNGKYKLIVIFN